jgi:cell division protein FtsZ
MGSAKTEGDGRALRAAEEALSSPLLNNTDILGAQKILLSIVSGEKAELQMDELTEITDYIQERAGDEAEVIFGHGIDETLGEGLSVTVIATGFDQNGYKEDAIPQKEARKVYDLESNKQITLFGNDQEEEKLKPEPKNQPSPFTFEKRTSPEARPQTEEDRGYSFGFPSKKQDEPKYIEEESDAADDFTQSLSNDYEIVDKLEDQEDVDKKESARQELLRKRSVERIEKLKNLNGGHTNTPEAYKQMEVPAYKRKQVKLRDVPHSSEKNISRYNLNDDNQILGNNKFLHDNVD